MGALRSSSSVLLLGLLASLALAQGPDREPSIGYLYPAGGQRGTTVKVRVGGQNLAGVSEVHVSGLGVTARFAEHLPPLRAFDKDLLQEIGRRLLEATQKRIAELPPEQRALIPATPELARRIPPPEEGAKPIELPDHPLLRDLASKSLEELREIAKWFFSPRNMQPPQRAIAEMALLELTITPDAPLGDIEIRVAGRGGMSNPLRFVVAGAPEVEEREPNDGRALVDEPPSPPFTLNGQILAGDTDRYRFRAAKGQRLVVRVEARRLVPYIADAVPGWFQATVGLYGPEGREVAYDDNWRFDPDPVLLFEVPEDGQYGLEIRDALYRGRDDFVYRVSVGEQPFVTSVFPLGGRLGEPASAHVSGWNLPSGQVSLDTGAEPRSIRETALLSGGQASNRLLYAVDSLPEVTEPASEPAEPLDVALPVTANGRIAAPGERDDYAFEGRQGDEVVAEILARRLNSPIDSLLRLRDASGEVLAWNDDSPDRGSGLVTHHADSYLRTTLPADGRYTVEVTDAQGHGGAEYAYRLRLSAPRPDYELRIAPSCVTLLPGRATPITVHAIRRDGFAGEIRLALFDGGLGLQLAGGSIPAGRESMRFTISAPANAVGAAPIALWGRAEIGGEQVERQAVPSEDLMQAFLWRQLVPAKEFLACTLQPRFALPQVTIATAGVLRIPIGGSTEVFVRIPLNPVLGQAKFELDSPPPGVSLAETRPGDGGVTLVLAASAESAKPGRENLIVTASTEIARKDKDGKPQGQPTRVELGALPAIEVELVGP